MGEGGVRSGRGCGGPALHAVELSTSRVPRAVAIRDVTCRPGIAGAGVRLDEPRVGVLFERAGETPQQRAGEVDGGSRRIAERIQIEAPEGEFREGGAAIARAFGHDSFEDVRRFLISAGKARVVRV